MTETQAKSGAAGTSATPVDEEAAAERQRHARDRPRGRRPGGSPRRRAVPEVHPGTGHDTPARAAGGRRFRCARRHDSRSAGLRRCRARRAIRLRRVALRRVVRAGSAGRGGGTTGDRSGQVSAPLPARRPRPEAQRSGCHRHGARGHGPGGDRDESGTHGRRSGWPGRRCGRRRCRRFRGGCRARQRGRTGRPYVGHLGRGPWPPPGPAQPQADRPVVGDEVLVRRLAGAVHRRRSSRPRCSTWHSTRWASSRAVNSSLSDLISAGGGAEASTFQITAKGVIGTSALIGLVNVVLFTALATLGAFIYNVCADLVGGIELTLAERD